MPFRILAPIYPSTFFESGWAYHPLTCIQPTHTHTHAVTKQAVYHGANRAKRFPIQWGN